MVRADLGLQGRPCGAVYLRFCVFCGSPSSCSLSAHRRAGWRFARSAGHRRSSASAVVRSKGGERPTWGLVVTGRGRLAAVGAVVAKCATTVRGSARGSIPAVGMGRGGIRGATSAVFAKCETTLRGSARGCIPAVGMGRGGIGEGGGRVFAKCATTLPPGQTPAAGIALGRCAAQGQDGRRSLGDAVLPNCATTLSPGQAIAAGLAPGGVTALGEGRAQVVGDVIFAKLRDDPPAGAGASRWARSGRGHRPGVGGAQVGGGTWFCEIAQRPSRRGRRLLLGSLPPVAPHRGRTGAGRGAT
jgi:hypothetical protein